MTDSEIQLAYELCLAGVGGAVCPDDLLSRLSADQWVGWQVYAKHFYTPIWRDAINTALIRSDVRAPHLRTADEVSDLLPPYGKIRTRRMSDAGLAEAARERAKLRETRNGIGS